MASGVVDVVLIPEVRFDLEGPHGLCAYITRLLREKGHCVVCVAEGAGQELLAADAKGNGATDVRGLGRPRQLAGCMPPKLRQAIEWRAALRALPPSLTRHRPQPQSPPPKHANRRRATRSSATSAPS